MIDCYSIFFRLISPAVVTAVPSGRLLFCLAKCVLQVQSLVLQYVRGTVGDLLLQGMEECGSRGVWSVLGLVCVGIHSSPEGHHRLTSRDRPWDKGLDSIVTKTIKKNYQDQYVP